jgi:hypothetical protein
MDLEAQGGRTMFEIVIKNEDGVVLTNAETEAIAVVYQSSSGCIASTMMETTSDTAFDIVLSLDMLKNSILKDDKRLKKMYKRRKFLVRNVTRVDLGLLHALLNNRRNDDDE